VEDVQLLTILAVLFQVSLAYMAVGLETIREVQRSSLILRLSALDRHTLLSRRKTAAAFANRVLISEDVNYRKLDKVKKSCKKLLLAT